jgi:uncharacterized membrane protein YoaK (UPF0700 family)
LNWNKWIRQVHRWFSAAFTVGFIIVSFLVVSQGQPAFWVYLLPLLPLALLLFTASQR